jgi:hypothetical protein
MDMYPRTINLHFHRHRDAKNNGKKETKLAKLIMNGVSYLTSYVSP